MSSLFHACGNTNLEKQCKNLVCPNTSWYLLARNLVCPITTWYLPFFFQFAQIPVGICLPETWFAQFLIGICCFFSGLPNSQLVISRSATQSRAPTTKMEHLRPDYKKGNIRTPTTCKIYFRIFVYLIQLSLPLLKQNSIIKP